MLHVAYLLLALWADPEPFGCSFEGWVQAVEVICSGTCATGLQVNSTLASSAVFIMMDLILQEKGALGKVNPLRTSLYTAFKASTAADRLLQTRNLMVKRTLTDTEDRNNRYMIATNTNNKWARSKFHKLKQKHKTQLIKHRRELTNIARLWHRNLFSFPVCYYNTCVPMALSPTRLIRSLSEATHNMNWDSSTKLQCHVADCYANPVAILITLFNKRDTDLETLIPCESFKKIKKNPTGFVGSRIVILYTFNSTSMFSSLGIVIKNYYQTTISN